ncbi:MAG: SDR family oxidoreductase [Bacteroidota bacterium]
MPRLTVRRLLIVGATSRIAHETCRRFAAEGASFVLAARDPAKLDAVAADLVAHGAALAEPFVLDATDYARHPALLDAAVAHLGRIDAVLVAHGLLPDQAEAERSVDAMRYAFEVNATSVLALLTPVAAYFEAERRGLIAVLSSVAGDRGRRENYVYGAAKAAVTRFLEGLRVRLAPAGVAVLTVKPGPVKTPMTAHLEQGILFAEPEDVADRIYTAMTRGRDIVHTPSWWRPIMGVLSNMPERVFKRLGL